MNLGKVRFKFNKKKKNYYKHNSESALKLYAHETYLISVPTLISGQMIKLQYKFFMKIFYCTFSYKSLFQVRTLKICELFNVWFAYTRKFLWKRWLFQEKQCSFFLAKLLLNINIVWISQKNKLSIVEHGKITRNVQGIHWSRTNRIQKTSAARPIRKN